MGTGGSEPDARLRFVNTHRANHLVGDTGDARDGNQRGRDSVDLVPVVAGEDLLFVAEHRAAQPRRVAVLPGVQRDFDQILARNMYFDRLEQHLQAS